MNEIEIHVLVAYVPYTNGGCTKGVSKGATMAVRDLGPIRRF